MCLSRSIARPLDLKLKLTDDSRCWYHPWSAERLLIEDLEGPHKIQYEEEEEKEEVVVEGLNKNNGSAQRFLCPGEAMPALDEHMLPLPSLEDFAQTLLTCRKERNQDCAHRLHSYICACGLETHRSLGNYLVPLLVEVGSIGYAQNAFDRLLHVNDCTWNSLIIGYIKNGELEQGFLLYQFMQKDESFHLSSLTFVALLKACAKSKDLEKGSHVHAKVASMNLEGDLFVGSALVDMYAKCGILIKAQEVFGKLVTHDVVAWTALLTGYAEHGQSGEALQFFEQMQLEGVFPDGVTFVCNLKACSNIRAIDKGREIHVKAACTGLLERDYFLASTLVDMYAKTGLLALAHQVFDKLPIRDVVSWTALIIGYVEHGQSEEALKCFEQMQVEGVPADAITVVCSLKACCVIAAIHKGGEIHAKIASTGLLESDIVIANTLVDMYAKCGRLSNAKQVFDKLPKRDVVSWTALISANVEHGLGKEALECLERMQLEGVLPNNVTYICSLKACSSIRAADKGQAIHAEVEKRGLFDSDHLGTALIDMYAKCGLPATAQEVFGMLQVRDVVSWTALISGFVEHGHSEHAINCFRQMLCEGVTPSTVTFLWTLKACVRLGPLVEIHGEMERRMLLERSTLIGTTLVDMYAKCGTIARAQEVFYRLPLRDVVSWNALIAAYADSGYDEEALECYERMRLEGFSADAVTYICSLKACGSIGAVDKGREIDDEIERSGLLERDFAVGTTLVGMYAKLGLFARAWEVFEKLPVRNVTSWNSLFSGYAEHGHSEEAMMCLRQMELEGISPNFDTLLCSLKGCGSKGAGDSGRKPLADVEWRGFVKDVPAGYTIVDMRTDHGPLSLAHQVFDKLLVQDVVSWTTLIAGYLAHGHSEEALECFKQMQIKGIAPDTATLICSLKACSSMGASEKGREIHAEIERKGLLNRDMAIGNTLVHMYAKCGYFTFAHQVFDKLTVRDVVSWTALIDGYAEHQQGGGALKCLEQMQVEGVTPDSVAFMCSLKACGSVGAALDGEELHAEIERGGLLKGELFLGTALVTMYSQHGRLGKAQEVFENLPVRGIVAWTALMAAYAERGLTEEALNCFDQMQRDGVSPDTVTFVCCLKACAKKGDPDKGREIHSCIEAMGLLESDLILGTALVDMYAKCGSLDTARQVFDRLSVRDVVAWTALMAGYTQHGYTEEALSCYEQMQLEGFPPNYVTYMCGLRTCGRIGTRNSGQDFHTEVQRQGLLEIDRVAKALVDMHARCGSFDIAKKLFYELPFRDHVLWTSLIGGLAEHGHGEEALAILDQMLLEGGCPDAATFICSLKACSSIGSRERGQELHAEIERVGLLKRDLVVGTTLVDMYIKCGMVVKAQEIFDKLPVRDVVSWTALTVGYAHYGYGVEALECFERMQLEGISPDPVTFVCVLKACSGIAAIDKGRQIHVDIERKGLLGKDLAVGNTLINMYAKNGLISLAQKVFDKLPVRDTVSWNALIAGRAQLGESVNVFQTFNKMLVEGAKPDSVTFKIVFSVCGRAGLFWDSQMYFEAMRNDYGIAPTLEHHISMVNLLCHVGHVDKAITMIKKVPLSSNLVLWNRVLEACRDCGHLGLGEQAFEDAISMER